tara:strand:- start:219 stop:629 length:411 start_codon:yes stop_codon:yes gene_type:complete
VDRETVFEKFERALGDLTAEQENLITLNVDIYRKLKEQRLEKRKAYQKKLYEILELNNLKQRRSKILELTKSYNSDPMNSPARRKNLFLIKEVLNLSTDKQNLHFKEKLKEYGSWVDSYLEEEFVNFKSKLISSIV